MRCVICKKETKTDEDVCHTCKDILKSNKNSKRLIEYLREQNEEE